MLKFFSSHIGFPLAVKTLVLVRAVQDGQFAPPAHLISADLMDTRWGLNKDARTLPAMIPIEAHHANCTLLEIPGA